MGWQNTPVTVPHRPCAFSDGKIRFLWVTDSHLADNLGAPDVNLRKAVAACNEWLPNALIHTGDIGDNFLSRVQRAFYILMNCWRPVYSVIGNHDEYEAVFGSPNTADLSSFNTFNRSPLYFSDVLTAPDNTLTARCFFLDCNIYSDDPTPLDAPGNSAAHEPGQRIGWSTSEPTGGFFRQFGASQLAFVEATLAADQTSDIVLIFVHYPPQGTTCTDFPTLIDLFQVDGRPIIGFCGHIHNDTYVYSSAKSTDQQFTVTMYKCPALLESGCWVKTTLHEAAGSVVIDELLVENYTDPGGWTINAPFTT